MDEQRIALFAGFAAKARKVVKGEAALRAIRAGKVYVVLVDTQASDNTKKRYTNACKSHHVMLIEAPEICVGKAIGAGNCKVMAVTDEKFAAEIVKNK